MTRRMPVPFPALLIAALGVAWTAPTANALTTSRVASGLNRPVFVTAPPGDHRLFIVEQRGVIKILDVDGTVLATPFLDIDVLVPNIAGDEERGLLGLAFHPDFATNRYFYINYNTNPDAQQTSDTVIKRYRVSAGNPNVADPADSMTVMVIEQLQTNNHKGGTLLFSPIDNYLYIGMGDGGGAGDTQGSGQSDLTLLGKMLRIDVDTDDFPAESGRNYGIPADNPHVGPLPPLDEIWAKGVRNPYRWSFDRLTGDIYIGEVGQDCWEEIDFQPAGSNGGENYGWNTMEGDHCFLTGNCDPPGCSSTGLVLPIHEYSHGGSPFRCSITGGVVYRGIYAPLQGTYFFADYCANQIWSFRYVGGNVTEFTDRTAELAPGGGLFLGDVVAFGENGFGELYIVDRGGGTNGEIYKLIAPGTGVDGGAGTPPARLTLSPARPNPFSATTSFGIELPRAASLTLSVYDVDGHLVRSLLSGAPASGFRTFAWDGLDGRGAVSPSGVYFLRAEAEGETRIQSLCLVR